MQRKCTFAIASLTLVIAGACDQKVTAPAGGEVMLESIWFANSEIRVGEPIVLMARTAVRATVDDQPFELRSSSGGVIDASLRADHLPCRDYSAHDWDQGSSAAARAYWAACTDEEITALIAAYENRVAIGIKEADAAMGVTENGSNITSDDTLSRMKEWLVQNGVTIRWESTRLPAVTGTMNADVRLVSRIRSHENIDYLEVGVPGFRSSDDDTPGQLLFGAVHTADGSVGWELRPGDRLDAFYRQPDGSVLTASTEVVR